jgi:alpha-2-macroglobulin-like protein
LNTSKSYQMGYGRIPKNLTDAYIVWALTESKIAGLETELDHLSEISSTLDDPYTLSLISLSLFNSDRKKESNSLMKMLVKHQNGNGCMKGSYTSITGSGGKSLQVETTALAALAWMKDYSTFGNEARKAIKFIHECGRGSNFGSTQATILALKAILVFDQFQKSKKDGFAIIKVNGKDEMKIPIRANESETMLITGKSDWLYKGNESIELSEGDNSIEIVSTEGCSIPFSFVVRYNSKIPMSNEECALKMKTKLSSKKFKEGESGEIDIELTNSKDDQGMTIAVIGLPGGLEPRHEQLKELIKSETIEFYEIIGRDVIIYWRAMEAHSTIKFKIDVIARIPGKYQGKASRAYLYYTDEFKDWVDALECEIEPNIENEV